MKCANCFWFKEADSTCHGTTPTIGEVFDGGEPTGDTVGVWPPTTPDDYCGSYQARLPASELERVTR